MVSVVAVNPTELLSLSGHGVRRGGYILPSLCPCRDMVSVVAVNPTELVSLRDMVLIVAVTSYQACVPVGT